ncbi:hypothetical protein MOQ_005595 [Trypanosoma cruzi marinkellei]|uniref:Uncharacterized protein n=1 Tax=Trypanosoma cruzi marinkellei TaxID=85056 RepID=K2M6Q8_TRYCR|nr:hypothetical protein MOQ_005595 [Trypanosoma cruzi marinkellei]
MKLRIHFGPESFTLLDANDVEKLALKMARIVQLALPDLFSKFVFSHDNITAPLVTAHGSARNEVLARLIPEQTVPQSGNEANSSQSGSRRELQFQLILEAQTKAFGPQLIINRKQWEWTREFLQRELQSLAVGVHDASSDVVAGEDGSGKNSGGEEGNEAVIPLEVILLYRCSETGLLCVCRHDMFAQTPSMQPVPQGVKDISVMDAHGKKMGEIRVDLKHPPTLRSLKQSLQTLLCWPCLMEISCRISEKEGLMSIETDADITNFVHSVQHFGHQNICLVVSLPSHFCLPPFLTETAAIPIDDPQRGASHSSAPPPGLYDKSDAVRQKREETQKMVALYVQLMRGLRQNAYGVGTQQMKALTTRFPGNAETVPETGGVNTLTAAEAGRKETAPPSAVCDVPMPEDHEGETAVGRQGRELLVVQYELDPVEVHITGHITEMELQTIAEAIIAICARQNASGEGTVENRFQRVSDSTFTLQLDKIISLDDAQVEELEACLVDVVKSFGCLPVCEAKM